jgi:subtilisin-like proprotein convertase family protein
MKQIWTVTLTALTACSLTSNDQIATASQHTEADSDDEACDEAFARPAEVAPLSESELQQVLNIRDMRAWVAAVTAPRYVSRPASLYTTAPPPPPPPPEQPDDPEGYEEKEPFEWLGKSEFVMQPYNQVQLAVIVVCNTDGSNCGTYSETNARKGIDGANAIYYRSGSRIRFILRDTPELVVKVYSDALNNGCTPVPDLEKYGEDADKDLLCPKSGSTLGEAIGKGLEAYGLAAVIARGGYTHIKWVNEKWTPVKLGSSGCGGHAIYFPKFEGGTFLAHELGHYVCLYHTHREDRPDDLGEAIDLLVKAGASYPTPLSPANEEAILTKAFDLDHDVDVPAPNDYLDAYQVSDTPPDGGEPLWKSLFGDKCQLQAASAVIPAPIGTPLMLHNFTLQPDRTNVLSYFKGCFVDQQHVSPDQRVRSQVAVEGHRAVVSPLVWVGSWQNTADQTIPPLPPGGGLDYATSNITTFGSGPVKRVKVHVSIKHDTGQLHIALVRPGGGTPIDLMSGKAPAPTNNIRTIFYVEEPNLPHAGTWTLKVADLEHHDKLAVRKLDGWRIEFE